MKVYFHYCLYGFSNCYILGYEKEKTGTELEAIGESTETTPGEKTALIIDPGCMDEKILNFIEKNEYSIKGILITHDHHNHVHGLRTLKKIYDADIYAINHMISEHKTTLIHDGDVLSIGPFTVQVFSVPGHSSDSAVYKIDKLLFTGDVLSAGLVGTTASSYGEAVQSSAIRSKILSIPGDCIVLPGHGPPSTLEAERRFNVGLEKSIKLGSQRDSLLRELW